MNTRIAFVILSFVLSIIIGLVLANNSPATTSRHTDKPLIGFAMDTLKEARWQRDKEYFSKKVQDLGAEVLIQAANNDDSRQIQNVESLIINGIDVLVIVPHNGLAMAKAVELAHSAGIPVIAYDRLINNCNLDLYITFDNVKVGEMQAQYLVDQLKGQKQKEIIRIYGSKTDNNAFLFKQGQDNVLNPYIEKGEIKVIHEDWAEDWKPEEAKKITNAAINKYGTAFAAVLCSNDGLAGGAIQALLEEGLAGKVIVTGQDADLAACQRIVNGTQSMTVYKPVQDLATTVAETAVKVATGKMVVAKHETMNPNFAVPTKLLDIILVTKDTIDDTVIKQGFHSRESVYK